MKKTLPFEKKNIREQGTADLGVQHRAFDFEVRGVVDEEKRIVEVAFSSDAPVERWFGREILSHADGAADLQRLNNGAPLLWMHNMSDMRGKVEESSARIDADGKGRCLLRISKSAAGEQLWIDIRDGIVTKISFGYNVLKARLVEVDEETGLETWEVTAWRALEVSFVSIPADDSVGMFRSAGEGEEESVETELEVPEEYRANPKPLDSGSPKVKTEEEKAQEKVLRELEEIKQERADAATAEEKRELDNKEILALSRHYGEPEMGLEVIAGGGDVAEFRKQLVEKRVAPPDTGADNRLGMDEKECKRFDFFKLVRAAVSDSRAAQEEADFELDCHRQMEERLGTEANGFYVPPDIMFADAQTTARVFGRNSFLTVDMYQRAQMLAATMQRDVTIGGGSAGSNIVGTDMLGLQFIDILRNAGKALPLATMFTDLVGDVAIPRHSTATLAYWVAESGAPTEGAPVFDQVTMSPKACGAFLDLSRKLVKQSSIDIQAWAFAELAAIIGLAIDLALLNGSGASNQPTGILQTTGIGDVADAGGNGSAPTWADFVNIKKEVAKDNALLGSPVWMMNSDSMGKAEATERASGTGRFILDSDSPRQTLAGFGWEETNQMPNNLTVGTGTNLSAILFGNMRDAIVGMWGTLDIVVDDKSLSTQQGLRISAFQDVDIAVRHAASFAAKQDADTA